MSLSYNPDADRLEGGDFFRDLQGHAVLQMLLSMRRAKALLEAAKDLKQRYNELPADPRSSERPFSEVLAVLQIKAIPVMQRGEQCEISVDELFNQPALADAPPEYRDLCQMILIIPGNDALEDSDIANASQPVSFAQQLFRTLGCAHLQAQMTFARSAGSCISPRQLTARGEVIDVYYLTRSSESKRKFMDFRKDDLRKALTLCSDVAAAAGADVMQVLREAREAYRGASKNAAASPSDGSWQLAGTVNIDAAIDRLVEDLAAL